MRQRFLIIVTNIIITCIHAGDGLHRKSNDERRGVSRLGCLRTETGR